MINENINIQLTNLLLDLRKNTSVKGVHKQITDAIRSVTQDYQKYTITKRMKSICFENNINIPDIISQQEKQYYSGELKKTNYSKLNLVNNSFFNIEHYIEIKTIKNGLLHTIENQNFKEEEVIFFLAKFFKENVRCFFKLTREDACLKPGVEFELIKKELVDPNAVFMKI